MTRRHYTDIRLCMIRLINIVPENTVTFDNKPG